MNGLLLMEQSIADLEEQNRVLRDTYGQNDLSKDIENRIRNLESRKNEATRLRSYDLTENMMNSIKSAIQERDNIRRDSPQFKRINFSQALLMKRMNMLNIKNLHKLTMIRKFSNLMRSQRSHEEFNMVFKYFEARLINIRNYSRPRRGEISYPYFRLDIEGNEYDLDKLKSCVPRIWFDEYHMIDRNLRENLLAPEFKHEIKKFYYNKCQHSEKRDTRCELCGGDRSTNSIEATFIDEISTHQDNVITEDDHTAIMEADGTILEVTWDELGSEIFSRTFQPSLELRMIMDGLKELN